MPQPARSPTHPWLGVAGSLSHRDVELLKHLVAGKSTGQLATALSVSTNTVRTRLRRVERKLQATGRAQVVRRSRELGIG